MLNAFANLVVCLKYLSNQKYYETVLCEKKEVKDNCCKGKCAMEKELNALNDDPDSNQKGIPKLKTEKLSEALVHNSLKFNENTTSQQLLGTNKINYIFNYSAFFFKPPTKFIV